MSIELPKDAEGREIPLDTEVLYSEDGRICKPVKWLFYPHRENAWTVRVEVSGSEITTFTELLFLTPPDSWEKLLEDLDRCIEADCVSLGVSLVLEDIKQRIRKLRGED